MNTLFVAEPPTPSLPNPCHSRFWGCSPCSAPLRRFSQPTRVLVSKGRSLAEPPEPAGLDYFLYQSDRAGVPVVSF